MPRSSDAIGSWQRPRSSDTRRHRWDDRGVRHEGRTSGRGQGSAGVCEEGRFVHRGTALVHRLRSSGDGLGMGGRGEVTIRRLGLGRKIGYASALATTTFPSGAQLVLSSARGALESHV